MVSAFAVAVLALTLLTILPGPDMAVVTRVALSQGRSPALRAAFGIVCGLLVWGLLTVAGLAALLAASATAYTVVKVIGAVYLVWLGLRTLWQSRVSGAAQRVVPAPGDGSSRPFRIGFASNLLNPKIAIFYTGLLPNLVPHGVPHSAALVGLVPAHAFVSIGWLTSYAAVVTRAAGTLQRPRVRKVLDRVTGLVLVGFGLRVAEAGRH